MIDIERYLSSEDYPESRLRESIKSAFLMRSDGCINGCIGVFNRWLPKMQLNGQSAMFTQKVLHAINVQVLGDQLKRVL